MIFAAAEQHGVEDVDDDRREINDLRLSLQEAFRVLTAEQALKIAHSLERRGMLAGWLP
jgi:hypothetical protein